MNVVWDGLIDRKNSLGILSCAMIEALSPLCSVHVSPWPESDGQCIDEYARRLFVTRQRAYIIWPDVWIRLCDPYSASHGLGTYKVPYIYHESSFLPARVVEDLNRDTLGICVMSQFQERLMQACGYKRPLLVVPNGVDVDLFAEKSDAEIKRNLPYTFLSLGKLNRRKGSDIIIRAFQEAFEGKSDARLILQTPNGLLEGRELVKHPLIDIIDRPLDREEIARLMRSCDCYVSATRSDASHMPGMEALASGLVLIGPAFSGMNDYLEMATVKVALRNYQRVPADGPGEWLEPNVEELTHAMRTAADQRLDGRCNGRVARERFTWKHAAQTMLRGIQSLMR